MASPWPVVFVIPAQDAPETGGTSPTLDSSALSAVDWVIAAMILIGGLVLSVLVRRAVISILRRGTTTETLEHDRRETAGNVVIEVHRSLEAAGITIPFPQRTVWSGERAAPDGQRMDSS